MAYFLCSVSLCFLFYMKVINDYETSNIKNKKEKKYSSYILSLGDTATKDRTQQDDDE